MEELEQKLAELESQLAQILAENKQFKAHEFRMVKKAYEEMIEIISLAVEQGDKLESDYKNLQKAMEQDSLLISLTEVNNPTSNILGFRFTDVISKAVENHFTKNISDKEVKEKFGDVVKRIVENPVFAAILTSNPVTGLVYRVIDKITDFSTNNSLGINLRRWNEQTKVVFQDDKLEAFYNEMTKYIDFYDALIKAAEKYLQSVEQLRQKNQSLKGVLEDYYTDLLKSLGVVSSTGRSNWRQIEEILKPQIDSTAGYSGVMEKANVMAAYKKAQGFTDLKERYENLHADYNNILSQFFEAYLNAFINAKSLGKDDFDSKKLSDLKTKIEARKKPLKPAN